MNTVLVLLVVTSILGPVLAEVFGKRITAVRDAVPEGTEADATAG